MQQKKIQEVVAGVEDALHALQKECDDAYSDRAKLLQLLSRMFPAYLALHPPDPLWDPDWMTILFIMLPSGQVSWHLPKKDLRLFHHLARHKNDWDGHDTEEKWRRVRVAGEYIGRA